MGSGSFETPRSFDNVRSCLVFYRRRPELVMAESQPAEAALE